MINSEVESRFEGWIQLEKLITYGKLQEVAPGRDAKHTKRGTPLRNRAENYAVRWGHLKVSLIALTNRAYSVNNIV